MVHASHWCPIRPWTVAAPQSFNTVLNATNTVTDTSTCTKTDLSKLYTKQSAHLATKNNLYRDCDVSVQSLSSIAQNLSIMVLCWCGKLFSNWNMLNWPNNFSPLTAGGWVTGTAINTLAIYPKGSILEQVETEAKGEIVNPGALGKRPLNGVGWLNNSLLHAEKYTWSYNSVAHLSY